MSQAYYAHHLALFIDLLDFLFPTLLIQLNFLVLFMFVYDAYSEETQQKI